MKKFIFNTEKKTLRKWNPSAQVDGVRLRIIEAESFLEASSIVGGTKPSGVSASVFDVPDDVSEPPVPVVKQTRKRK